MWSAWIHAEKQQQVHRQHSNITDHRNQRASKCANPSIHYRASLSPSLLAPWSSVLLPVCFDFSPFTSCMEDSGFFLMFHIYWAEKPMSGLNQHSFIWGDDGKHQLHFWMEKKQHRSLLAQANEVYSFVNLFKCPSLQPIPQRLEISLWGHGHQCHLPCNFHLGGEWAQKQPDWIHIFCLAEPLLCLIDKN